MLSSSARKECRLNSWSVQRHSGQRQLVLLFHTNIISFIYFGLFDVSCFAPDGQELTLSYRFGNDSLLPTCWSRGESRAK